MRTNDLTLLFHLRCYHVTCLLTFRSSRSYKCCWFWLTLALRLIVISVFCIFLMFLSIICVALSCVITVTMVFYSNPCFIVNLMPFIVCGKPFRTMFYVSIHVCDFIVVCTFSTFTFLNSCVYSLFSVCLVACFGEYRCWLKPVCWRQCAILGSQGKASYNVDGLWLTLCQCLFSSIDLSLWCTLLHWNPLEIRVKNHSCITRATLEALYHSSRYVVCHACYQC